MLNKFKRINRSVLGPKLHKVCKCKGIIVCVSQVWGSFGVNDNNNKRILLSNVSVENIFIDHVWVKSKELNNRNRFRKGFVIFFNALIHPYQKINGAVGIGLFDLTNIEIRN
ncbi:hypothetical protein LCGC14_0525660 [marine sediment metagenome]|uniref:Uncharacterized protein n=1 Tax=marine sediment metagenome TaxID=412755 RepID=A0A0F9V593_9ZZZZ|nr:hypothetical protein [bacterium]